MLTLLAVGLVADVTPLAQPKQQTSVFIAPMDDATRIAAIVRNRNPVLSTAQGSRIGDAIVRSAKKRAKRGTERPRGVRACEVIQ